MNILFRTLERTIGHSNFFRLRWQFALVISVVFLVVMFLADEYTLKCDGQTCTITKQKKLMGLFKKEIIQFKQAEVDTHNISCHQHTNHNGRSRRSTLYRKTHKICKLDIVLKDGTVIDTHQTECYSSIPLINLFQDIKYGEIIEREN